MLPPPTPKAAPSTDNARPITDIIETAATGPSCADAHRRHQLNAVLPARAMPRPLQPSLVPTSCPKSTSIPCVGAGLSVGLHAAASRPDNKASHAPCTVQH